MTSTSFCTFKKIFANITKSYNYFDISIKISTSIVSDIQRVFNGKLEFASIRGNLEINRNVNVTFN